MLIHWDDVEPVVVDHGDLRGRRRRLASACGAPRLGLSRYEIDAGERVMPVHVHADEEEIFYVLRGAGVSVEGDASYSIAAGDVILYPAGGAPHTVVAGPEGLDVLAFGSGGGGGMTWLPRPNVMWAAPRWIPLDGPNPFRAEAAAGPLDVPPADEARPATIAASGEVSPLQRSHGEVRQQWLDLGRAIGSRLSGLRQIAVAPAQLSNPPHCHSAEDELFVILDGDGTLELMDQNAEVAGRHELRAGHVVSRPAGTGVAHAFRGGPGGMELLAYGHRDPVDVCFYPRSQKLSFRGLGVMLRVQRADYWDGEA